MDIILTIASNTFRETIRNKVLYNILLFVGVLIVLSVSFGDWSVFARVQVMNDFGLAAMSLSGLLLAVFIGSSILGKEISGKTIYLTATKPINRASIIWGKFLGVYLTLFLNFLIMSAVFAVSLTIAAEGSGEISGKFGLIHVKALTLLLTELGVILAFSLLFSVISSPTLAAIFTIGFYIIGHFNHLGGLTNLGGDAWLLPFLQAFNLIMPNLDYFNLRAAVVLENPVSIGYVFSALAYGILFMAIALTLAAAAFEKKDLS
ncbi:MAG: ABC transporter permease subunit [Chitinivibrionia bacterium]|nr:ABC transporter permease subunit [Chitinivibrionia bacterium]